MTEEEQKKSATQAAKDDETLWLGLNFAWELGYTITVPAVAFLLLGRYLDKYLNTGHLFLFLGLLLAIVISSVGVVKQVRNIINRMPKDLPKQPKKVDLALQESEKFHEAFRPEQH